MGRASGQRIPDVSGIANETSQMVIADCMLKCYSCTYGMLEYSSSYVVAGAHGGQDPHSTGNVGPKALIRTGQHSSTAAPNIPGLALPPHTPRGHPVWVTWHLFPSMTSGCWVINPLCLVGAPQRVILTGTAVRFDPDRDPLQFLKW